MALEDSDKEWLMLRFLQLEENLTEKINTATSNERSYFAEMIPSWLNVEFHNLRYLLFGNMTNANSFLFEDEFPNENKNPNDKFINFANPILNNSIVSNGCDCTTIENIIGQLQGDINTYFSQTNALIKEISDNSCCSKEIIYEVRFYVIYNYEDPEYVGGNPPYYTDWYSETDYPSLRYEIATRDKTIYIRLENGDMIESIVQEKFFQLYNYDILLYETMFNSDYDPCINIDVTTERRILEEKDCEIATLIKEEFEDLTLGINLNDINTLINTKFTTNTTLINNQFTNTTNLINTKFTTLLNNINTLLRLNNEIKIAIDDINVNVDFSPIIDLLNNISIDINSDNDSDINSDNDSDSNSDNDSDSNNDNDILPLLNEIKENLSIIDININNNIVNKIDIDNGFENLATIVNEEARINLVKLKTEIVNENNEINNNLNEIVIFISKFMSNLIEILKQ